MESKAQGVFGPTISVDPAFDFYKSHPWSYWAKKIKEEGMTAVDIVIVWNHPTIEEQKPIVQAFHNAGLACRLRLYPTTDGEAYQQHPEWRQKLLNGQSKYDWRVYLCPNDTAFSAYMENKIEKICHDVPYDAIQLAEPWFEVWGGPYEENPAHGAYACLCDNCRRGFEKISGVDPILLFDKNNPYYFRKSGNKELYKKWIKFRVDSLNDFSIRCYAGAKRGRPGIKTIHMYLSDCNVKLNAVREYQAMDLEEIVTKIKPDMITIEDAWQDWTRPDLKPDFVLDYGKAYVQRIKKLAPDMKIQTHLDIGSGKETKRNLQFMREFSAYSVKAGFDSPSFYEYSVQKFDEK